MGQIFKPRANTIGRIALAVIAFIPIGILLLHAALMNSPWSTGENYTPQQPVPFSHKHHVTEDGIDCRYCHFSVERSAIAGVPPTEVCMSCHAHLWTDAKVLAPVRASYATGTPLHWQQVNRLPGYVYFDHSIHIAKGIGCTTCHGAIGQMPLTYQARNLTMGWCLSCHRNPAPYLRPKDKIFALDWKPETDRKVLAMRIKHYGIDTRHITECSTCHR